MLTESKQMETAGSMFSNLNNDEEIKGKGGLLKQKSSEWYDSGVDYSLMNVDISLSLNILLVDKRWS